MTYGPCRTILISFYRRVVIDQRLASSGRTNFRLWLKADIQPPENDVRFTPNFGRSEAHAGLPVLTHNGLRPLAKRDGCWSLTTLREKLAKIDAKVVSHGRYVTFQMAEVAVPRELFRKILRLIDGLRPAPLPP